MEFREIQFGRAEAENEISYSPNLLINGFLDTHHYVDEILDKEKFLIVGPKGSGKSALGIKVGLEAENKEKVFVKQLLLRDFSFKYFSELLPGTGELEERLPSHWEFLLMMTLLDSYQLDPHCRSSGKFNFRDLMKNLKKIGLIPVNDFTKLLSETKTKNFTLDFKVLKYSQSKTRDFSPQTSGKVDIKNLYDILKDVCYSVKTDCKHIIIIDDLDYVLTLQEKQYRALTALIMAADRMNKNLKLHHIDAKIVVLIRSDLLDQLSNPNLNKINQDMQIPLEWYEGERDIENCNLVKLANIRARLSLKKQINVFDEFFPEGLKGNIIIRLLLEYTRNTPRDLIILLSKIQKHTTRSKPTMDEIRDGINEYSTHYFKNEIHDELVGFLSDTEIDEVFDLLVTIRKSHFTMDEAKGFINRLGRFNYIAPKLNIILSALYNCSAIGNYYPKTNTYTFKHWNTATVFQPDQPIFMHKGLHKAFNVTYMHGSSDFRITGINGPNQRVPSDDGQ